MEGWPEEIIEWELKCASVTLYDLRSQNGLLMRGSKTIFPASIQYEILQKMHTGHHRITIPYVKTVSLVAWSVHKLQVSAVMFSTVHYFDFKPSRLP